MLQDRGWAVRAKKIIKIAGLNLGIAMFNIILFSPGLLGIKMGGASVFATAFGATVILMSGVAFVFGNYNLLTREEQKIRTSEIKTEADFITALAQHRGKKTFSKDSDTLLEQIERFQKKKQTINDMLLQKFSSTEMSYSKFQGTILAIENLFYMNIKSILNKLNAFDEEDYNRMRKDTTQVAFSKEFIQTKMGIYHEYISFVKESIEDNEQILLKLDKLLLETSRFNSLEDGEIENMSAMQEIDELINKTKFYK